MSIEQAGEKECFDFEMANHDRPYAVVEDFLVHNCGKKNASLIAKEREEFVAGCERTGYGTDARHAATSTSSSRSPTTRSPSRHAYGYGYIAYQTAYLKANYPAEYFAALLTSVKANLDKAAIYLAECRTMGIEVLVPDVNRSVSDFTPVVEVDADAGTERRSIVFGLSAVRNVGSGLVGLLHRRAGGQRPLRRLLRLRRAGRLPGAEQEDDRVADQGRRASTASATPARACCAPSSTSSTPRCRAGASATWASCPCSARSRTPGPCSTSARRSPTSSSPSASGSASRRRCSASTSATTR